MTDEELAAPLSYLQTQLGLVGEAAEKAAQLAEQSRREAADAATKADDAAEEAAAAFELAGQAAGAGAAGSGPEWVAAFNAPAAVKDWVRNGGGKVAVDSGPISTEIQATIDSFGLVRLTTGKFPLATAPVLRQGNAMYGSSSRSELTAAPGLSDQFILVTGDHVWVSDLMITGTDAAAGTDGLHVAVADKTGFLTGSEACFVATRLVIRRTPTGGDGVWLEQTFTRDTNLSMIHVANSGGRGFYLDSPDGKYNQLVSGSSRSHGVEVGKTAGNSRFSTSKMWYAGGDGFRDGGFRSSGVGVEAQDNHLAGFRFLGGMGEWVGLSADSNSNDVNWPGRHAGIEVGLYEATGIDKPGGVYGGNDLVIVGGQSYDKNEAKRGFRQGYGIRLAPGIRGLQLMGLGTGDPAGTHHNLYGGVVFVTPSDLNHPSNLVSTLNHRVRMVSA